jgi:tryptophan synthase alpha chain
MLRSSRGYKESLNNLITIMNRIDKLFSSKKGNILSIYFTAGYPNLHSTAGIIKTLAEAGVDMIEIGMPFSDPMADGPVIQNSNQVALQNGMNLKLLFDQLSDIRKEVEIPLILMGYLNPVLQFGVDNFCAECYRTGIDGVILPDLPPQIYTGEYISLFNKYNIYNILLISPQSSVERILELDKISRGFVYMVSSSSVTGTKNRFTDEQILYFRRVRKMDLKNPCLIGFGISTHETFADACKYSRGGIIGSGFVKILGKEGIITENIVRYINEIRI